MTRFDNENEFQEPEQHGFVAALAFIAVILALFAAGSVAIYHLTKKPTRIECCMITKGKPPIASGGAFCNERGNRNNSLTINGVTYKDEDFAICER